MLLFVSTGGEPAAIACCKEGVGPFASPEFAEPGGLGADTHSSMDEGRPTLMSQRPEIGCAGDRLRVRDEVERFSRDRSLQTPQDVLLRFASRA